MEFMDLPRGFYLRPKSFRGILVQPDELDAFKQYLQHHNVRHCYENIDRKFDSLRRKGTPLLFYFLYGAMHYCSPGTNQYYKLVKVSFSILYEEKIDTSDFLAFLQ